MTINELTFPVMMYEDYLLEFFDKPSSLVCDYSYVKMLNKGISQNKLHLFFVDSAFQKVVVERFFKVRGVGLLSGYHFAGPFLERRIEYSAEVRRIGLLSEGEVVRVIISFLKKGNDVSRSDINKFKDLCSGITGSDGMRLKKIFDCYRSL